MITDEQVLAALRARFDHMQAIPFDKYRKMISDEALNYIMTNERLGIEAALALKENES